MKRIVLEEDILEIADDIIKYGENDESVLVVGYYDTINILFNHLMKATETEFVSGILYEPEWDGYDDAYALDYSSDGIYIEKATVEGKDGYCIFENDHVFVEEDFVDKYLEVNPSYNVVVFGFNDVRDDEPVLNHDKPCFCMDKDNCGFTFCVHDDNGCTKYRYKSSNKLTPDQAWKIIEEEFS